MNLANGAMASALLFIVAAGCTPTAPETDTIARTTDSATADAKVFETMDYRIRVVTVAKGLSQPYSLAFLPDGSMLVAEIDGRLRLIRDGALQPEPIPGMPEVKTGDGGGLMDVVVHPRFAENNFVYFTYNKAGDKGVTIALARGRFDGNRMTDIADLLVADAWSENSGHLSSRIAFAPDATLYMTLAERHEELNAQNMGDHMGKVLRLRDDGSPAPGNPFEGRPGHRPEIFTFGHRNPHGVAINPETGDVWEQEHGDEINILKPGANYGWPYVSVGGEGGGEPVADPPAGIRLEEPRIALNPAIGSMGMMFYTGDKFPEWQGNLFVGGTRTQGLLRIETNADNGDRENVFTKIGQRLRDVRQGPDGFIYFTTDDEAGVVMRIERAE